ncbi:MAG: tetratricopeptide repeat protein, partial [Bacteroidota bacterium]
SLSHSYSTFSNIYRELGAFQLAQIYLDSSFLYVQKEGVGKKLEYLELEQGFIYSQTDRYKEAIPLIEKHIPYFEKNLPAYRVLIYNYLGDAYLKDGNATKAEGCFHKALDVAERYHSHINFAILQHEKLSTLYFNQQNYVEAYEQLKKTQQLDRLLFDSRSENNRPLLEIQDEFHKEMENKRQYLKEQRLAQLEYENEVTFLQNTIISVLFGSSLIFGFLYFKYIRNKHRIEKIIIKNERELEIQKSKVLKKQQDLEIQKNRELLALKNKELATSALKLIEKDEFLLELKNRIVDKKEKVSLQEIKHLIKTATVNNTDNWTEFEARFIAVNVGFYDRLRARFPKLTQGDRKLCALIKLKFTSKEIARLMGLSVESVHTTRYRLRKKLGLKTGTDLTDFMDKI